MKLRLTAMILLSLCLSQAFADEGMWLLGNLRKNKSLLSTVFLFSAVKCEFHYIPADL